MSGWSGDMEKVNPSTHTMRIYNWVRCEDKHAKGAAIPQSSCIMRTSKSGSCYRKKCKTGIALRESLGLPVYLPNITEIPKTLTTAERKARGPVPPCKCGKKSMTWGQLKLRGRFGLPTDPICQDCARKQAAARKRERERERMKCNASS